MFATTSFAKRIVCIAIAVIGLGVGADRSIAQGTSAGSWLGELRGGKTPMAPARPTLSPYLDLLRADSGVISPYHAFVVPKQRIARQQRQQSSQINRLQSQVQRLDQTWRTGRQREERTPTGHGGVFQQYSHFYPTRDAQRR